MAGHSKWANIKHRKEGQDAKRGKIFTKLIKEITVAARLGGGESSSNPKLRWAIDKALSANMTRDTINRAIQRGVRADSSNPMEEVVYEGYGIAGVAILIICLTDNKKRTVADVRHALTKCGGNLGTDGSVAYLFTQCGVLSFNSKANEEAIMELAMDVGADDVICHDNFSLEVITPPYDMLTIKQAFLDQSLDPDYTEISMRASSQITLTNDQAEKLLIMLNQLEDLDDVQNVYTNALFPNV